MSIETVDCIESALAAEIADLEALAWEALCDGRDDDAERINGELVAARVEFSEFTS